VALLVFVTNVRKALVYLLVLIGVPVVGFLLLEGAARLFGPEDLLRQTYDPMVLDLREGRFLFVNRAGYRGVVRGAEIAINSQHLQGPELVDDGRPRLLLLGDSVLFSASTDFKDSPGPVLERALDGRFSVLNAASIGYCTEHELAYLNEFGDNLKPDVLVLGYCLNDPMSMNAINLVGVATANSKRWGGWLLHLNLILRKHSLFFVWLKGTLRLEKRQNGYKTSIEPLFDDESWGRNRQILLDIFAWCKARNIPFMLVVFPHREQLELGEPSLLPQRRLKKLAGEFPIVDLTNSLTEEDFMFGDPLHFDRNGIRKAMEVVAEAIKDTPWATNQPQR
jgi:hypothetical protein